MEFKDITSKNITENILDIKIEINSQYDAKYFQHQLKILNWTDSNIKILPDFENSMILSKGTYSDRITIVIKEKDLFISKYGRTVNTFIENIDIPRIVSFSIDIKKLK